MRIIISPAKKMVVDRDTFAPEHLPMFLERTQRLLTALQSMSAEELRRLWKCSASIADRNIERLSHMSLCHGLTPALLAYEGIQYRYMAPGVFESGHLDYVREHLRILSGFYGLLRPFDGVVPYRLEMQAKLSVDGYRDLYAFWGTQLADALSAETELVLDLASKEYSKAVVPHLPPTVRVLSCTFGERQDGRVVEKGTLCKMARGQMVRWAAEHAVVYPEELQAFSELGYRFSPEDSSQSSYVFIKESP